MTQQDIHPDPTRTSPGENAPEPPAHQWFGSREQSAAPTTGIPVQTPEQARAGAGADRPGEPDPGARGARVQPHLPELRLRHAGRPPAAHRLVRHPGDRRQRRLRQLPAAQPDADPRAQGEAEPRPRSDDRRRYPRGRARQRWHLRRHPVCDSGSVLEPGRDDPEQRLDVAAGDPGQRVGAGLDRDRQGRRPERRLDRRHERPDRRPGLGRRHRQPGSHPHQQPRGHRRRRRRDDQRHAERRPHLRRQDRRHRPVDRPRGPPAEQPAERPRPDVHRRLLAGRRRPAGHGHRQPARPLRHRHHGHRQRAGPPGDDAGRGEPRRASRASSPAPSSSRPLRTPSSPTRSRPPRRSTPATPAARSSRPTASSSASTARSPPSARPRAARAATSASGSPSR